MVVRHTLSARYAIPSLLLLFGSAGALPGQGIGVMVGKTNSDIINVYQGRPQTSYPDRHASTFGVTYRQHLASWVVLEPELLRVQRGWAEQSHPTLSLTYLELPVLLRLGALSSTGWPVRPTFTVGAALSVLQSCSLTNLDAAHAEGSGCAQRIVSPFTEDYGIRRNDVGAILGVGGEARIAGGTIVGVEGRYELGLNDIRRDDSNSHNSTFFVLLNVVPRVGW